MKTLGKLGINLLAIIIASVISVAFSHAGITLGGIPTALIFAGLLTLSFFMNRLIFDREKSE